MDTDALGEKRDILRTEHDRLVKLPQASKYRTHRLECVNKALALVELVIQGQAQQAHADELASLLGALSL